MLARLENRKCRQRGLHRIGTRIWRNDQQQVANRQRRRPLAKTATRTIADTALIRIQRRILRSAIVIVVCSVRVGVRIVMVRMWSMVRGQRRGGDRAMGCRSQERSEHMQRNGQETEPGARLRSPLQGQ